MPPRKKRRPSAGDDLSAKKSRQESVFRKHEPSQIREEDTFSNKRCLEWFYEYAGCDDVVGPDGMEKFCEDIGVEPENVVMLVLAWKLDAQSMGYFTLQEWLRGMGSLQCDSTERLRNSLDYLRSVLNDSTSFKLIYRYAFDFARPVGSSVSWISSIPANTDSVNWTPVKDQRPSQDEDEVRRGRVKG